MLTYRDTLLLVAGFALDVKDDYSARKDVPGTIKRVSQQILL
jgi:hypothetical protein